MKPEMMIYAGASLIDGIVGLATLGHWVPTLRSKTSLWIARRRMK